MHHRDVGGHAIGPNQLYSMDYAVYHGSRCDCMPRAAARVTVALDPAIAERFTTITICT